MTWYWGIDLAPNTTLPNVPNWYLFDTTLSTNLLNANGEAVIPTNGIYELTITFGAQEMNYLSGGTMQFNIAPSSGPNYTLGPLP